MKRIILAALVGVLVSGPAFALGEEKLTPTQKEFIDRFLPRIENCVGIASTQTGISREDALKFCNCQSKVFAQNFSKSEMDVMTRLTFKLRTITAEDEAIGMEAIMRVMPIRQKECGM